MKYKEQTGMSIEEAFEKHLEENPLVYAVFTEYALKKLDGKRRKISAKNIIARIREANDGKSKANQIRINDAFTSFYVRKFIQDFPEYNGAFSLRKTSNNDNVVVVPSVNVERAQIDFYFPDLEDHEQ